MIDTHTHIYMPEFEAGGEEAYLRASESGVDVMIMPDHAVLRIAGAERSAALVKERFLKLDDSHIGYVLGCLQENTSKVGNIKAYLLASLYNAALTIDNYYRAEVNHDLYGSG